MSFKSELRSLVRELDEIDNAAVSLWSWLPSQSEAMEEMVENGENPDYVFERQPQASEMMLEACSVIAYLLGHDTSHLTDKQKQIINSCRQK